MAPNSTDPIGGALWLRPGWPPPHNLRSSRPAVVEQITRGRPAGTLPETLGRLFGLCSGAHRACAGMAVRAALARDDIADESLREAIATQTARDHVQMIWLDWPRQLASPAQADAMLERAGSALAQCPAFAPAPVPGALASWLQRHALGMAPAAWLAGWERDPAGWLNAWCLEAPGDLPRLLADCRDSAGALLPAMPPLQVYAGAQTLRVLADRLRHEGSAFARQPTWQGGCAETGVWTRRNGAASQRLGTAWLRLGARLAELARLALPDEAACCGSRWLALGALPLDAGEAIAWVEMARGLLIHHVQLEGSGDDARVAACQVIAPTEWNFHPDGTVARVVAQWPREPATSPSPQLGALVAAYSPCVPVRTEPQTLPAEAAHA